MFVLQVSERTKLSWKQVKGVFGLKENGRKWGEKEGFQGLMRVVKRGSFRDRGGSELS